MVRWELPTFQRIEPGGQDGGQINGPNPDINQFNGIYTSPAGMA